MDNEDLEKKIDIVLEQNDIIIKQNHSQDPRDFLDGFITELGKKLILKGVKGDTPKVGKDFKQPEAGPQGKPGPQGDKPTDKELVDLIIPLIPEPIPGEPGEPGADGLTPTTQQILSLVKPLIPTPLKGKKGDKGDKGDSSSDTGIDIVAKLSGIEGKDRLSFYALKDQPQYFSAPTGTGGVNPNSFTNTDTIIFSHDPNTNTISANAQYQVSIDANADGLKLVGDELAPGVTKYYGTGGLGQKGWFDIEAASIVIGSPVGGGTANSVLFTDVSGNLANDSNLSYVESTGTLTTANGVFDTIAANSITTSAVTIGAIDGFLRATAGVIETTDIYFTDIADVPNTLVGQANKLVAVKADETGLEFITSSGSSITIGDPVVDGNPGDYLIVDGSGNLGQASLSTDFLPLVGGTMSGGIVMGQNFLTFNEISAPSSPGADQIILFSIDDSGTTKLATKDSAGSVTILGTGGGGGDVDSVFGRTGVVVAVTNDYTWGQIDKTVSNIVEITDRSHTSLTDVGTYTHPEIDDHINDFNNPHQTTAAQVGAVALTGNESVDGIKTFTSLPESTVAPTTGDQLANKTYVDTLVTTGSRFVGNLQVATTVALPSCTYENGASGVGATLTATSNGALTAIDGVTLVAGNAFLVKNQVATFQNGPYTITQIGTGGTPYILTRDDGYNTSSEIATGTFFTILLGTTQALQQWAMVTNSAIVVGTTGIVFAQLSAAPSITFTNGLTQTGTNVRLGGALVANTTITHGAFSLTHNLDSTGDFIIQDAGVTAFQVDDAGSTRIGSATNNLGQLAIQPISPATRGQLIRGAVSQTAQLWLLENSSGVDLAAFSAAGKFTSALTSIDDTTTQFNLSQKALIHQEQSNTGTFFPLTTLYSAAKFTATGAYVINTLGAWLRASGTVSNPRVIVTAYIYSDSAGDPGTNIYTSQSFFIGGITTAAGGAKYQFGSLNVTTVAATDYWVVLRFSGLPAGANIEWQGAATGTNIFSTSSNGSAWTTVSSVSPRYSLEGRTGVGLWVSSPNNIAGLFVSINTTALSTNSTNGTAIVAATVNGTGLVAISTYGTAILGTSTSGKAISSSTVSGVAVTATSTTGTGGQITTTSGTGLIVTSTTGISATLSTTSGIGAIVLANPTTTNTTHELLRLTRNTSGTAATGIGSSLNAYLQDAGGQSELSAGLDFILTDVTNGAEDSVIAFRTRNNGTVAERARLDNTGKFNAVQLESTVSTGTAPLVVASTTLVTNLNADLLDGQTGGYYLDRANQTGTQGISTITMNTGRLLGRTTASTGAVEEITPNATNFTFASGALNTVQNIDTGATPTFATVYTPQLDTTSSLTIINSMDGFIGYGGNTNSNYAHEFYGSAYFNAGMTIDGSLIVGGSIVGTWGGGLISTQFGGTGLTTWTQGDISYYTSGTVLSKLAKDTNATRYLSNQGSSNSPAWNQINLANGVTGDLPFANITQGAARSVLGVAGNSTADVASIVAPSAYQILVSNSAGTGIGFTSIDISQSNAVGSSILKQANGGTNSSSAYGANRIIVQNAGNTAFTSYSTATVDVSGNLVATSIRGNSSVIGTTRTQIPQDQNGGFTSDGDIAVGESSSIPSFFFRLGGIDYYISNTGTV